MEECTELAGNIKKLDDCDESEDDVIFLIESNASLPHPKTFELSGLVKRENDRFSGDIPFAQKVCIRFAHFFYSAINVIQCRLLQFSGQRTSIYCRLQSCD